jgi:hypothetical protein
MFFRFSSFFSAYGPIGGMPGGHSVFSEQNPQPETSGAADGICPAVLAKQFECHGRFARQPRGFPRGCLAESV